MTLSNFDWTDKDSIKWFILLPKGHEGPYSLDQLAQFQYKGKIGANVQVWAEGLTQAVALKRLLTPPAPESIPHKEPIASPGPVNGPQTQKKGAEHPPAIISEEVLPPPLPTEVVEDLSPLGSNQRSQTSGRNIFVRAVFALTSVVIMLVCGWLFSIKEEIDIRRHPGMSPELFERIVSENQFRSWKEAIFFREYLANDFSHIWLVTGSFQDCEVNASFTSLPDKLLSMSEQTISFRTEGVLRNHVVKFNTFDFLQGKIGRAHV